MKKITLFCDGSCLNNPGIGGWAYILMYKKEDGQMYMKKDCGYMEYTTNNQMEMLALIKGLNAIKKIPSCIDVYTDSRYLVDGVTIWMHNWALNGWKVSKSNTAIKNKDLWQEIFHLYSMHDISMNWVKGHSGNKYNEECDKMAKMAANSIKGGHVERH